jgi:hypothetical protein
MFGHPKPALICPLPKLKGDAYKPYEKSDIATSLVWVQKLLDLNKSLSQPDLADKFLVVGGAEEAALSFLLDMTAQDLEREKSIKGCQAIAMGKVICGNLSMI